MFVASVAFMGLFSSMAQAEVVSSSNQAPRRLRSEATSTKQLRRGLANSASTSTNDEGAVSEEAEMFWNEQERRLDSDSSMSMSMSMSMPTENLNRCLDAGEFQPNVDYFPQKVQATGSERWSIAYFNSYKVITHEVYGEEYLLVQCGAPFPEDIDLDRFKFITNVPLQQGVGLTGTREVALMERAGRREDIAYLGNPEFIGSPCLNKLIADGDTTVLEGVDWSVRPNDIEDALAEWRADNPDAIVFVGGPDGVYELGKTMVFDTFFEEGNFDRFEWIKVIGALYNDEQSTNDLVNKTEDRYQCISSKAEDPSSPIKVAWGFFSTFGTPGWEVADPCEEVDNYYCQMARACDVEILSDKRHNLSNIDFVEFTKDADVLIYTTGGVSFQEVIANAPAGIFDGLKYVQNQAVFDILKSGEAAWFEQSPSDYDNLLFDFCDAAGITFNDGFTQDRKYLRNIYTTEEGGDLGECDDASAPWIPEGSDCTR
jgi:hypothetical protein